MSEEDTLASVKGKTTVGMTPRMVSLKGGLICGVRGSYVFEVECDGGSIGCKEVILSRNGGKRGKVWGYVCGRGKSNIEDYR